MALISNYKTEIATANYFKRPKAFVAVSVSAVWLPVGGVGVGVGVGVWVVVGVFVSMGLLVPVHHHIGATIAIAIHLHPAQRLRNDPQLDVVIVVLPSTVIASSGSIHSMSHQMDGCLGEAFPSISQSNPVRFSVSSLALCDEKLKRLARQWADCLMSDYDSQLFASLTILQNKSNLY